MEVISGMEVISNLAPRPSTPVPNSSLQKRGNVRGSMSAPSSPARTGGASGFFPMINRLPSQDSMDRSTHTEGSTHGKSASQIIKELKQSNAAWSAKTATMEADFMNQLNHATRRAEEQKKRMEETLKKSEQILTTLESRCKTSEHALKEREDQLAKVREESAFQRHTISDLKNQLHQMELEKEEAEFEKNQQSGSPSQQRSCDSSVVTNWNVEKLAMQQEIEDLKAQVQDGQVLQQEVDRLNNKLQVMRLHSTSTEGTGDDESVGSGMGNSIRSSYTNRSFMKQNLPQTRETLKKTKHKLSVTEAALDILKQERVRMMEEHQMEVEEMQEQIDQAEQSHREREEALKGTIRHLEQQHTSVTSDMDSSIDGPGQITTAAGFSDKSVEAEQTIQRLQEQIDEYATQVTDLTAKLEKAHTDAKNQEAYRADEAEDLRVLHDAQEEEIERLRKEVDDLNHELELRDQELEEQKLAMEEQEKAHAAAAVAAAAAPVQEKESPEDDAEEPTEDTSGDDDQSHDAVDPVELANLRQRLKDSEAAIERLEIDLDNTRKEHHDRVEHLERVVYEVTEGKDDAEEQLAQLSAVLMVQTSRSLDSSSESEVSVGGNKAVDLTTMLRNVEQLQENERKAIARIKELEYVQAELEELKTSRQSETHELEELVARLKDSEAKLASTRDGAMEEYRAEIQKLRGLLKANESQRVKELEKRLQEARSVSSEVDNEMAALVEEYMAKIKRLEEENANDKLELEIFKEEKAAMLESHMKTLQQLDDGKTLIEEDYETRLEAKNKEISELKQALEGAELESEELRERLEEVAQQKQELIENHMEVLDQLKSEKDKIEQDFHDKLVAKSSSDSHEVALLKQELEKLQKQILEEQEQEQEHQSNSNDRQIGSAAEKELRKQMEKVKRQREEDRTSFKEKLEDRDTTISTLVKTSVGLEQKIAQLTAELESRRYEGHTSSSRSLVTTGPTNDDEVYELREALSDYKEVEKRLIHELGLTKRQLKFAESEISRLQEVMDDEVSCDSHHYRRQIQERDDAVSSLVQQSMAHENEMQRMKEKLQASMSELESLKHEKGRSGGQLRAELRRLHQESEIFAGQIIEQDEELEALRADIRNRDEKIVALERQLAAARGPNYKPGMLTPDGESPEVVSLKAVIDELEEANETYRVELRDLRFKLRDAENVKNELERVKFELTDYERKSQSLAGSEEKLQTALDAKRDAEHQLEELLALNHSNSQEFDLLAREKDALVSQRDKIIEELRRNIDGSTSQIDALETEIDALRKQLKNQSEALRQSEEKSRSFLANAELSVNEHSGLFEEVEELQQQVKALESENGRLSQYKDKMMEVEAVQEQSKKMAEAYERKLNLLSLDKDATIDSLQKALMEIKGQATEDFDGMARDLKKLDRENQTLRAEMEKALEKKNNKIFALEHTLDAQEQLVANMRSEMDQLQGSMVNNVYSRKEEFEDMEKEVLDLTTRNAAYEREITSLKMQLEENKLASMSEINKLEDQLLSIPRTPAAPEAKSNPLANFPIHEVKDRLESLRKRNQSIQEENFKLKSRLERAEAEVQSARNEQYRTSALESKVGALTKLVEKLEKENQQAIAKINPTDERPPISSSVPSSPARRGRMALSLPGSRSSTPTRRSGTLQQREESQQRSISRPGSRQATPQRKRAPLQPRTSAQKQASAPNTPNGCAKKRGFFGSFRRKSDRENPDDATQSKNTLVPSSHNFSTTATSAPTNPKAPNSSKSLKSMS